MYDFSISIEILSPLRADGNWSVTAIVSLEEIQSIASCHNPRTLVVQERSGIPLENCRVMAEILEGEPSCQTT